jgi:vancomycin resistance protein VanJ
VSSPRSARRPLAGGALAGVIVIAVIEWVLILLRPESGLLAILEIVAPHLAIVALCLVPIALLELRPSIGPVFLLVIGVSLRFGGDWVSIPPGAPTDSRTLEVITWNLEAGATAGSDSVAFLRGRDADVVALQELRPDTSAAIEADPTLAARYPYRVLIPREDVLGMGLLSDRPILNPGFSLDPAVQTAMMDLGDGRRLAVINAHPFHAEIEYLAGVNVPFGLESSRRNADLDLIRNRIDDLIGQQFPVLLLGDLNTAASEPAFDRFVDGLRESHRDSGFGPGWTWRPSRLEFLGLGLVRIDHLVVSPDIVPLGIEVTCPPAGDHCLVNARFAVPNR